MKEITSIPNASRTFDALRNLGYDLNASIADVVDNAITEKVAADSISITFSNPSKQKTVCRIQDNGCGMSHRELEEAMRLGTETTYEEKDLGKFGMGMKTASLSHCNILTVISKKRGSEICAYRWDIGHVRKKGWTLLELTKSEVQALLKKEMINLGESGTIVLWEDVFWLNEQLASYANDKHRNNFYYRLIENVKLHLGMVYHRFLDGSLGEKTAINLSVNDSKVEPWDPFCRGEANTKIVPLKSDTQIFRIQGYKSPVRIAAYVVPAKEAFSSEEAWKNAKGLLSWNDSQGYYIYRANRIIRFGGWHGTKAKDEHDKLARLSIDIDSELDELFRITVNKARVQFPQALFQHLKNVVNPVVVKKAKSAYNKSDDRLTVNNRFRRNDVSIAGISRDLMDENEIKTKNSSKDNKASVEVNNPTGTWLSNKVSEFLKYGNEKDYEIISDILEEDSLWKIICDDESKFKVIVNAAHPFYKKVYSTATNKNVTDAVDALIFSLAFAELYNKNDQNAGLLDTFKSVCSQALKRIVAHELI
ncbi:ATP-binding protein [Pedobacter sp. KR3-3]|uniref:ATP-binding protein n=1 Tax=Pedobacter albus TaxID=3113905 RepID=A0ABU7IBW3_9SPHI|nr:ATP-binding protein [Pedobacter sp. KR3-3]MEE1946962.1 ATP-binding protein [Pedobacter sp. KR3-3]